MSWKNSLSESELFTYDYFFLDHVCRLCWGAEAILELTSFNPKAIENDATIAEKLQDCVGIDFTAPSHPKKVCENCLNEIELFTEFKRFCQESDRKLHAILEKGPQQKDPVKNEDESKEFSKDSKVLKSECEEEFSNLEVNNSIDNIDISQDLLAPLSYEITEETEDKPVRKRTNIKRSENYCNSCHTNLESAEKLKEHNLQCHGIENGIYKCLGCPKSFHSSKKRLRHEAEICKELKCGYQCFICGRFLPKRKLYEIHMKAHNENEDSEFLADLLKCSKCMKTFNNADSLRVHMFTHYKKEVRPRKNAYVCDVCGRFFTRHDYLYKHKLVHDGNKSWKCPHCDYKTVQKSSLTVHIRKHTGERPYPCDLCPHRCVTSSNLREHRKRHLGIKSFECKLCDRKFGYKASLAEHISSTHHQSKSHSCSICGSIYARFRGLRRHLLVKHGKRVKKLKDGIIELEDADGKNGEGQKEDDSRVGIEIERNVDDAGFMTV